MPSRNKLPCLALENTEFNSVMIDANFSATRPCVIKSISSSGKSKQASTNIRKSINFKSSALIRCENSPDSDRTALLAASMVAALITSATASAWAKSILSFK